MWNSILSRFSLKKLSFLERKTCCKCTHLGEKLLLKRNLHHVDLNKAAFINELGKYNVTVFGETLEELEQEFLTPRKL